jgi:hypothetical protein
MKNIAKILIVCLGVIVASCDQVLVEDPVSLATSDGHFTTEGGIEDGLKASYTTLRSLYGQQDGFFLTVTGTDIFTNGFGGIANNPHINNYSPNFLGTSGTVTAIWDALYRGVNQCNTVVNKVDAVPGLSEENRRRITAEARFLRAFFMHSILDLYAKVPFREPGDNLLDPSTVLEGQEAIDFIISEVEQALPLLSATAPAYRANQNAARALLAMRAAAPTTPWRSATPTLPSRPPSRRPVPHLGRPR